MSTTNEEKLQTKSPNKAIEAITVVPTYIKPPKSSLKKAHRSEGNSTIAEARSHVLKDQNIANRIKQ
ncbi:MAG: hypothetical protein U0103_28065 [Candidatus Obscuribacterales bacterium]